MGPEDTRLVALIAPAVRALLPAFRAPEVVMAPNEAAPAVRPPVPASIELFDVLMVVQNREPDTSRPSVEILPVKRPSSA
jgi:hypothetical protein